MDRGIHRLLAHNNRSYCSIALTEASIGFNKQKVDLLHRSANSGTQFTPRDFDGGVYCTESDSGGEGGGGYREGLASGQRRSSVGSSGCRPSYDVALSAARYPYAIPYPCNHDLSRTDSGMTRKTQKCTTLGGNVRMVTCPSKYFNGP